MHTIVCPPGGYNILNHSSLTMLIWFIIATKQTRFALAQASDRRGHSQLRCCMRLGFKIQDFLVDGGVPDAPNPKP